MTFASITVTTDSFVLLDNFTFANYTSSHLMKEYLISVTSYELFITFIPRLNSLVFVNAIEVVSMPDVLFPNSLNPSTPFTEFTLETVYRLNVGGANISAQNDTLSRNWESDETYFQSTTTGMNIATNISAIKHPDFLEFTAPPMVYVTAKSLGSVSEDYKLSWEFRVSPNFFYFVRVHFCDMISNSTNSMVLDLFMNGYIAFRSLDLLRVSGDLAEPYYKDFVFEVTEKTLTVSVGPATMSSIRNATMNGIEIMKFINKVDASKKENRVNNVLTKTSELSKTSKLVIIIGCGVSVVIFLAFLGLSFCYQKSCRLKKNSANAYEFLRHFTLHEIQHATNGFDAELLIGVGGFGKVYKGKLENGKVVAIKVANPESRQGLSEFHNEIELLSGLRHQNLVSLVGCCNEDSE
ncbi:receptor-like protein kinase THESEUS 1-like, partial [Trifolium medium]|nr:receptor-like protein kinase THESEUS 1-like [Trifolium medium]